MPTRFDFSDPHYLTIYSNDEENHNHAEDIQLWLNTWADYLDQAPERFGVILVNHVHEHDEHEERNEEEENAVTAVLTTFRRKHRQRANQHTIGYASVYPVSMTEEQWEKANARTAQFAGYTLGVRGRLFKDLENAKAWLTEIAELDPLPLDEIGLGKATTTTTAIFYGSTTGTTESVAEKVQEVWQETHGEALPIVNVGDTTEMMKLLAFDQLLIGVPTWNIGKLQDDWEIVYPYLDKVDLRNKQIAIFGVGDQYNYAENFQDAIGILGRKFLERGATLVGYTSTNGYEHSHSLGIEGNLFMGLAIDEINQYEQTDSRIKAWITQVKAEFQQTQMSLSN